MKKLQGWKFLFCSPIDFNIQKYNFIDNCEVYYYIHDEHEYYKKTSANKICWYSDGSGYFELEDGSKGNWNSDGSGSFRSSDGNYGSKYSDGSGSFRGSDGSEGRWDSNGNGYFQYVDNTEGNLQFLGGNTLQSRIASGIIQYQVLKSINSSNYYNAGYDDTLSQEIEREKARLQKKEENKIKKNQLYK